MLVFSRDHSEIWFGPKIAITGSNFIQTAFRSFPIKFSARTAIIASVTLPGIFAASAQTITTGDVTGRVVDSTGGIVSGASVTLTSVDQGTSSTLKTDHNGTFRFALLRPGNYNLSEEGLNLSAKASSIVVSVGNVTDVNLTALPGVTVTTVEVSSEQELLQTDNANVTTTFGRQQIEDLPIAGGDLTSIPLTVPGATLSTGGGLSSNFFIYGLPGTSNLFTLNGADLMDPFYNINNSGSSNNTIGAQEIESVSIVTPGYSGQYGRLPGANVNYITKGGSNRFHGSGKYQYNGSFLNAEDWFKNFYSYADPQQRTISNEYGIDIGGYIIKDKLFFYFDDEGLRYVASNRNQVTIPTPAFANAVLANVAANQPAELSYYKQIFSLYAGANGASTATPLTPATDPQLGCSDFNQAGFGVNAVTGTTGAACAATYNSPNNSLNTEQFYAVRIDQNFGSKDKSFYRYKHDFGIQATATDPINQAFSANSVQPEWEGQFNETHIFTPALVNNFTAAGSYYKAVFGPTNIGAALAVFPTTVAFPSFSQLGGSDNAYPSGRDVAQYQFVDDLVLTKGRSTYKAGVNFRRNNFSNFANQPGTSGLTTISSLTDFYNGVISNLSTTSPTSGAGQYGGSSVAYSFPTGGPIEARFYSLGLYVEDDVKMTSNFQLTATLRFDRNSDPYCRTTCFTRLVGPFSTITHGAAIPYDQSIQTGNHTPYSSVQGVSIQPRVGFTYSPGGTNSKTVFRGGAGVFADSPILALTSRFLTAAPSDPAFTLQSNGTYALFAGAPNSAYTALAASNKAFQAGFAANGTLASISSAVAAAGSAFSAPNYAASVNNELKNPKYVEYNLEVQRQIGKNDALDVNYVGNFAYDIFLQNGNANAYAIRGDGFGGLPNTQTDPRFKAVTNLSNDGNSNYNGLVTSYRHQARYGLTVGASYTFSKALGNTSNGGLYGANAGIEVGTDPLFQIDPTSINRLNYGPLDYDVRHSANMNYVWTVPAPFHNYLAKGVLGGWTVSGVVLYKSGLPFSIVNTAARTREVGSSATSTSFVLAGQLTPNPEARCSNPHTTCLTTAQFATTANQVLYGFGNRALNSYRGPSFFDTDLSVVKGIRYRDRYRFQVGAIASNALNHPNFSTPVNSLTAAHFGTIQSTVVSSPSSLYGNGQGSAPSGRVLALTGGFNF